MTTRFLFYLLILFLPTQLGRHFFLPFSFIEGIRIDYLAPTIYVTDVLILLLIIIQIRKDAKLFWGSASRRRLQNQNRKGFWENQNDAQGKIIFLSIVIGYLLFSIFFISSNTFVSIYKLIKIIEMIILGCVIVRLKPKKETIVTLLSIDVVYTSFIAITQFVLQRSVGGYLWFLGERTFYASTPAIAAISLNNQLILRPYATFSHPNVLGGFLAVLLPLFIYSIIYGKRQDLLRKILLILSCIIGFIALVMTFSRAAWTVFAIDLFLIYYIPSLKYFIIKKRQKSILFFLYTLIILSIIIPFIIYKVLPATSGSLFERTQLNLAAIKSISSNAFFGVGMQNSLQTLYVYLPKSIDIYRFQPVHNLYLLLTVETGLVGLFMFLTFFLHAYFQSFKKNIIIFIALTSVFLLGLFDHYLFTLQQGLLLFTIFTALAFLPSNT